MVEITPILKHFQDGFTGKVPFDQINKSQEDDQCYEDPLECKNICGRPKGANNRNRRDPAIFEIIESKTKRRGRPPSKVTSMTTSRSQLIAPPQIMEVDPSEDSAVSLSK
ncbi:hypothetical protein O181_121886 [Austropuccinia psidii MF-1]|uniref:Uncharacterized protein n=1 Tax=Austropuccinia psidii MF-1 TaxID=1389203 RepID=A0A9Q3Q1V1_9BASI|nr:hypothetical protein [Austropuccinia psidii MF-1]